MDTPPEMLLFFGSGMVAATCLMVPGFSGVFILLILGKYLQVATAFGSILYHSKGAILLLLYGQAHAGMSEFRLLLSPLIHVLAPFAIGGILALWIFSSAIGFLLKNFRNMGMSVLLGLMLGSLHKLWPFREVSIYIHQPGQSDRIIQDIAVIPYWEEPLHICALILVGLGFMLNLGLTRILSKN
jgi:putative membrane protein